MPRDPDISSARLWAIPVDFPDTIWPEDQIRRMVEQAIEDVGGKTAFEGLGPKARRAILKACAWKALRTGASGGSIAVSPKQMYAVEAAMFKAAGMLNDLR